MKKINWLYIFLSLEDGVQWTIVGFSVTFLFKQPLIHFLLVAETKFSVMGQ